MTEFLDLDRTTTENLGRGRAKMAVPRSPVHTYHENNRIVTKTSHRSQECAKIGCKTMKSSIIRSIIWTICEFSYFFIVIHEYRIIFFQKKSSCKYNHIQLMFLLLNLKQYLWFSRKSLTLVLIPAGVIFSI